MDKPILVTGGTGTLGRPVVAALRAAGEQVRVLSRHAGEDRIVGDLLTRAGIAEAVDGVGTIIHCATTPTSGSKDTLATRNLIEAARKAGEPHLLYISIVGIDVVPYGYYRGKLACERLIADSGLPYTILRATQFHDLLVMAFHYLAKLPIMLVPSVRDQPVEVAEVAARLVELASGEPLGRVPYMGGPEVRTVTDLARAYLRATDRKRPVVGFRLPGKTFRAFAAGGILTPDHADGTITFERYLADHPMR